MKSNVVEIKVKSGGRYERVELVTLTTYLMKQSSASNFTYAISSEDYPPKIPSDSSQHLFQVQQYLPFVITLGNSHRIMVTKVTNYNNSTWGDSHRSDVHVRAK